MKYLGDAETDKYSLEVHECECGFHFGVDTSYLEQVGGVDFICPNCEAQLYIEGWEKWQVK